MVVREEHLGNLLREKSLTIAVAESCTGGLVAERITDIAGSSTYFMAGLVTYSNDAKNRFLSVPSDVIETNGAVSAIVAEFMANGVRSATGVDIGLSITGIAGPDGGTPQKPVGTVFMALSTDKRTWVKKFLFNGNRREIRQQAADAAFEMFLDFLEGRLT